jgi:hypothetical protein
MTFGIAPVSRAQTLAPSPRTGEAWRLLGERRDAGKGHWTAIAADTEDYRRVWEHAGLAGQRPDVDFVSEIVIWFGASFPASCRDVRLDDVAVDHARSVVHAVIVVTDASACPSEGEPYAFVVAVRRDRLPVGPFVIQLDADGPPADVPEERAMVGVDLSRPGSDIRRRDIRRGERPPPEPTVPEPGSGAVVEPDQPSAFRLDSRCGTEWLGPVNDGWWRTEVPSGDEPFVPPPWLDVVDESGGLTLTIVLRIEPSPTIEAEANEHTVTYIPSPEPPPACAVEPDGV